MRSLGEEIAVLDGLDAMPGVSFRQNVVDPAEGQNYSGGSSWTGGMPLLPSNAGLAGDVSFRNMVVDPAEGANYSGGSSWTGGMPLLPSNAGLAGLAGAGAADRDVMFRSMVVDPAEGANYSGGSSWTGGMPLLPSNAGLAGLAANIQSNLAAGVDRSAVSALVVQQLINMLGGNVREDGVWGKASAEGFVRAVVMSGADEEKDARAALVNILPVAKGRLLLMPTKYVGGLIRESIKKMAMATGLESFGDASGVLPPKFNVVNPSFGANYSGGSSWTGGVPLLSSNAGLASLRDAGSDVFARYSDDMSDPAMFSGVGLGATDAAFGSSIEIEPGLVTFKRNMINYSEGANYSGGSNYVPGLPLLTSTIGLAELVQACPMDGLSDAALTRRMPPSRKEMFARIAGQNRLKNLKARANKIANAMKSQSPMQRRRSQMKLRALDRVLGLLRQARVQVARG